MSQPTSTHYRETVANFPSGVTVVTTRDGGEDTLLGKGGVDVLVGLNNGVGHDAIPFLCVWPACWPGRGLSVGHPQVCQNSGRVSGISSIGGASVTKTTPLSTVGIIMLSAVSR